MWASSRFYVSPFVLGEHTHFKFYFLKINADFKIAETDFPSHISPSKTIFTASSN